jgi:hypothetical protein
LAVRGILIQTVVELVDWTDKTLVVNIGGVAVAVAIASPPEGQLLEAAAVLADQFRRVVTLYLVVTVAHLAVELLVLALFRAEAAVHLVVQTLLAGLVEPVMWLLFLGKDKV